MISTRLRNLLLKTEHYRDEKVEYHPEPNVRNHLGQVATLAIEAEDTWEVVFASALHDIAKNTSNSKKWAQHAYRGASLISADVTEQVRWLVEQHMRAIDYSSGKMRAHKRQALESHEWFDALMRLHKYDCGGRNAGGLHFPWEMPESYTAGPTIFGYLDSEDPRKNEAIVMIGIQASGKSTISGAFVDASRDYGSWWKPGWEKTSKDDIRLLVGAGPGAYRHQENCVNDIQRKAIRMALGRGQGIIIDNCHNTIKRRRDTLEWLHSEFPGIHVEAHLVYAPLDVCIQRNQDEHGQPNRHRLLIPEQVLKQFHGDLVSGLGKDWREETLVAKLKDEGFDDATITRTA